MAREALARYMMVGYARVSTGISPRRAKSHGSGGRLCILATPALIWVNARLPRVEGRAVPHIFRIMVSCRDSTLAVWLHHREGLTRALGACRDSRRQLGKSLPVPIDHLRGR